MSILVDPNTRILVQGITGGQAIIDSKRGVRYGAKVVAGVTPGRGDEHVNGIPVYDTVAEAMQRHDINATAIYAPPLAVRSAALEAIEQGISLLVVMAEGVPVHDATHVIAAARERGLKLIGCNTNGVISPGQSRIGGIGGEDPSEMYVPGRIGICSRSGGMSAELARTLKFADLGVSTCVSMGGDRITGLKMADYALLFEEDPETDAIVVFGEPGTSNERGLAELLSEGPVTKPVVALIAGAFQESYPAGQTFGHAAALVRDARDSASAKMAMLRDAGAIVASTLDEMPTLIRSALHQQS